MRLFDNLRRLFAPRPPTPTETAGEPTADRPPPDAAEAEPAPLERAPSADVLEVRAALEAIAEAPVPAPTPDAEASPPTSEAPSTTTAMPTPLFPRAETTDAATPLAADHAGEALVLTLAAPAATFTVAKTTATIGRGQENTVRLDDLSVSRRHARIAYRQGGYWLSDLGSMGGTWVDGTRLNAPHRLAAGEVIDIGVCRLTVSAAGAEAKADGKKSASRPRAEVAGQTRRRR
jgi:hypothetical protein